MRKSIYENNLTKAEHKINEIKEFLNHNLNTTKYINEETTVKELLQFLDNLESDYLAMYKEIYKMYESQNNRIIGHMCE